jgi:hypothetical protein
VELQDWWYSRPGQPVSLCALATRGIGTVKLVTESLDYTAVLVFNKRSFYRIVAVGTLHRTMKELAKVLCEQRGVRAFQEITSCYNRYGSLTGKNEGKFNYPRCFKGR